MFKLDYAFISEHILTKMMDKNYPEILARVHEDDSSLVRLSKEIGVVFYCLHKFYPTVFSIHEHDSAIFVKDLIDKEDDYILQLNGVYNLPVCCLAFNKSELDCAEIYYRFSQSDDLMST